MFKGIFGRIVSLVVMTLLLNALLTSGMYTYFSRKVYTHRKKLDMISLTRSVCDYFTTNDARRSDFDRYGYLTADAQIILVETDGSMKFIERLFYNGRTLINPKGSLSVEELGEALIPAARTVLAGSEISREERLGVGDRRFTYLLTGAPFYTDSQRTTVRGAILMVVPLMEVQAATDSLTGSLILSSAIAMALMLIISFFISYRIIQPLRQMRTVANAMTKGDFNVRAQDADESDEIGQLGLALNTLAQKLSRNIYELVIERNRLRRVLDGLGEGIVAVDATGVVTHVNPALHELFRAPGMEKVSPLLNLAREEVVPLPSLWDDFDQSLQDGIAIVRTLPYRERMIRVSITPLEDERERIAGSVGLFRDVTETERLEQTRRDYVANVSHELRTPLTGMRALIEPLYDGLVTDDSERMRYYGLILGEITRLGRLINDLLELSRLQSGTVALQKESFPLEELLLDVADKYSALAAEKGFRFEYEHAPLGIVHTNADRIEQVLVVLLDNALKYTTPGCAIELTATPDEAAGLIRVAVADQGEAIPDSDIEHVFDRFYKVDKAHSGNGTGLGLSIAREILQLLGETITASSQGGVTKFEFTVHMDAGKTYPQ